MAAVQLTSMTVNDDPEQVLYESVQAEQQSQGGYDSGHWPMQRTNGICLIGLDIAQ